MCSLEYCAHFTLAISSENMRWELYKSSQKCSFGGSPSLLSFHKIVAHQMLNQKVTLFNVSHVGRFHKHGVTC